MKTVIILALVAIAAASHSKKTQVTTTEQLLSSNFLNKENIFTAKDGFFGQQYGLDGNNYHVPQYVAYQFYQAHQLGYTPAQVSQFLMGQGFPQYVAQYLAQQYEAGLSQPYFQSPYHIFQYYQQQEISQEVYQYIAQKIDQAFQQFQNNHLQYGKQAYQQHYSSVPQDISEYVFQQAKYYGQNGLTYSQAQISYKQLQIAQKYAQYALQYFVNKNVPQVYQYVFEQLQQGLVYIQNADSVFQTYQTYQQNYYPYYAAQYYAQEIQQAYQYFQNAYQYIQKHVQTGLPETVMQQVQFAYLAVQKAYNTYQPQQFDQTYFQGSVPSYDGYKPTYNQGISSNYFQTLYYYKQVLQYIQMAQQLIASQGTFPQASHISQQLTQAYKAYQTIYQFYQQRDLNKKTGFYGQEQIQQAYQFLNIAYQTAQQEVLQYLVQQLQFALQYAQKLQLEGQYSFNSGNQYGQVYSQYGSNYGKGFLQFLIQKHFNKTAQYPAYYNNQFHYGPYNQGYGYSSSAAQYRPYNSYGYQYRPYVQNLKYNGPSSSSFHQYASYEPYSTYKQQYLPYGIFNDHSEINYPYQYESYKPLAHKTYQTVSQFNKYPTYQYQYGFGAYPYVYSGSYEQTPAIAA